jgi:NCAIR mutase (PurE)-related protein
MTDPVMDWDREARTGLAEAVFAPGKTPEQLAAVIAEAQVSGRALLITRLTEEKREALDPADRAVLDFCALSGTAILGTPRVPAPEAGTVGIVTGGMADLAAALEAQRSLSFGGVGTELIADVGVAGLWRLMDRLDAIRRHDVLIAVAGMEGALFSVLAGLVHAPIIALPVSCGTGVAEGGRLALDAALGSCAPGLVVVNIDNGFGAAQAAMRILRSNRRERPPDGREG